jgi:hypothetical protein
MPIVAKQQPLPLTITLDEISLRLKYQDCYDIA